MRWIMAVAAGLLLIFGLLCLNYTKADGLERHREVARRHNLPPPGESILFAGAVSIAAGAGLIGYLVGISRRPA